MIGSLSLLALTTVRGGSKGLPFKNLRPLGGQPAVSIQVKVLRPDLAVLC